MHHRGELTWAEMKANFALMKNAKMRYYTKGDQYLVWLNDEYLSFLAFLDSVEDKTDFDENYKPIVNSGTEKETWHKLGDDTIAPDAEVYLIKEMVPAGKKVKIAASEISSLMDSVKVAQRILDVDFDLDLKEKLDDCEAVNEWIVNPPNIIAASDTEKTEGANSLKVSYETNSNSEAFGDNFEAYTFGDLYSGNTPSVEDGVVGLWHFNESSGVVFADSTANANSGELKNGASLSPSGGRFGGASNFVASSSQYGLIPHHTAYELSQGTIDFWFWCDDIEDDAQGLISKDDKNLTNGDLNVHFHTDGHIHTRFVSGGTEYQNTSLKKIIANDRWHHGAVSFGSLGFMIFIDGHRYIHELNATGGLDTNLHPFFVGISSRDRDPGAETGLIRPFNGKIDGLRIRNTQISDFGFNWIRYTDTEKGILTEATATDGVAKEGSRFLLVHSAVDGEADLYIESKEVNLSAGLTTNFGFSWVDLDMETDDSLTVQFWNGSTWITQQTWEGLNNNLYTGNQDAGSWQDVSLGISSEFLIANFKARFWIHLDKRKIDDAVGIDRMSILHEDLNTVAFESCLANNLERFRKIHLDYFSDTYGGDRSFHLILMDGETNFKTYVHHETVVQGWNSISFNLSDFDNVFGSLPMTKVSCFRIKIIDSTSNSGDMYIDNIYAYGYLNEIDKKYLLCKCPYQTLFPKNLPIEAGHEVIFVVENLEESPVTISGSINGSISNA